MAARRGLTRSGTYRPKGIRRTLLASLLLVGLSGCQEVGVALGESPATARTHADSLFFALGARFGPVNPVPGYVEGRAKFSRAALIPSRIFDDPDLWTASRDESRIFEIMGRPEATGYTIGIRNGAVMPRRAGEYRRYTRLDRQAGGEFEWTIRDELAVGPIAPNDLARALSALLHATERIDPHGLRDGYRRALPRSTRSLGRLFSLDSLALERTPGAGTLVSLTATIDPSRMADEFPQLSRYLERYAGPARFDLELRDDQDVLWWTAVKERDRFDLRFRVHEGRLAPLAGPPRPMPDRMRLHADFATRIRIFNIRAADLEGDVSLRRTPREKSFTVRFREEPEWHLPPLAARLIRGPLRRPFEGQGAMLSLSARSGGEQTLLVRDYRIAVQESAILRWFGGLGSTMIGDFRRGAEEEYDRFLGEVFAALRADAQVLIR